MDDTQNKSPTKSCQDVVTAELLHKVILQRTGAENIRIKDFSISPVSKAGDKFISVPVSVKVVVQLGGEETIHNLFIKIPPTQGIIRDRLKQSVNLFTKESLAYSEVFPAMVALQIKKGIELMGPSVPLHYYSIIEKTGGLVVLEDLCSQNYTLTDKIKGVDEVHCRLVMKELATFHALGFALKNENVNFNAALQEGSFFGDLPDFLARGLQLTLHHIKDMTKDQKIIAAVGKLQGIDIRTLMKEQLKPVEPYASVCHGDLWCNNLLFNYEIVGDNKMPVAVKLIDLQCIRYACPTTDLAYFFYTSTTRTTRKKHIDALLALYHFHFTDCLKRLDISFPEFSLDFLKHHFKQSALFGILASYIYLPAIVGKPELLPAVAEIQEGNVNELMSMVIKHFFTIEENHTIINERVIGGIEEAVEMELL